MPALTNEEAITTAILRICKHYFSDDESATAAALKLAQNVANPIFERRGGGTSAGDAVQLTARLRERLARRSSGAATAFGQAVGRLQNECHFEHVAALLTLCASLSRRHQEPARLIALCWLGDHSRCLQNPPLRWRNGPASFDRTKSGSPSTSRSGAASGALSPSSAVTSSLPVSARRARSGDSSVVKRGKLAARNTYDQDLAPMSVRDAVGHALYLMQGLDGSNVRFDSHATFCFAAAAGADYVAVRDFIVKPAILHRRRGLIFQAFVSAVERELDAYCGRLSDVKAEVARLGEHDAISLGRLPLLTRAAAESVGVLRALVERCAATSGGALVSLLLDQSALVSCDEDVCSIGQRVLPAVWAPLLRFVVAWLCDGQLNDPFDEFFVSSNATTLQDRLWSDKYSLRQSMLPACLSQEVAESVLVAGKSVNFVQLVCKERLGAVDMERIRTELQALDVQQLCGERDCAKLEALVDRAHRCAGARLLRVMADRYEMQLHFHALKKYMLLSQGDFTQTLMDLLHAELNETAAALSSHTVNSILAMTLQLSSARFEPADVRSRIDVDPLEANDSELGWDIFMLKYSITGPLQTVIRPEHMEVYRRLFHFVWKIRRSSFSLRRVWLESQKAAKVSCVVLHELSAYYRRFTLMSQEVLNFLQELLYYFTYEVLECAWAKFVGRVAKAKDLDCVIGAHEHFLATVSEQTLQDDEAEVLRSQLGAALEQASALTALQRAFADATADETAVRVDWERQRERIADESAWGVTQQLDGHEADRRRAFVAAVGMRFGAPFVACHEQFRHSLQQLLVTLASTPNERLRAISVRIDFNKYYQTREPRLEKSMRYSSINRVQSMAPVH